MKISRTVTPNDKPTNFDEFESKKLKPHNITKVDNYVFSQELVKVKILTYQKRSNASKNTTSLLF